jgi:hypothetical protein
MESKVDTTANPPTLVLTLSEQEAWNLWGALQGLSTQDQLKFSHLISPDELHALSAQLSVPKTPEAPASDSVTDAEGAEPAPFVAPDAHDAANSAGQPNT